MNWSHPTQKLAHVSRIFHIHIHISRAELAFSSGSRKEKNKSRGRLSVSSIMSVFLPKRVKVGSQIDAYWGILSLLDLYFLQQSHDRG